MKRLPLILSAFLLLLATSPVLIGNVNPISGGIQSINSDTTPAQTFRTSKAANLFTITSNGSGVVTFQLPDASTGANGTITTVAQTLAGSKTFVNGIVASVTGHASQDLQSSNNLSDVVTPNSAFGNVSPMTTAGDIIFETATPNAARLPIGTSDQILTVTNGLPSWKTPSVAQGTVTSLSVITANGLWGTISNPTTTPAITLFTSVNGLMQGNGSSISSATTGNLTDSNTDGISIGSGTGAVLGSGTTISQVAASAIHNGYLTSTSFTSFNSKQSALTFGNLTDQGGDGITVGNGSGSVIGSGTTISQQAASATQSGYLTGSNFSTFSAKQPAGNYLTALTGDGTAAGPGSSALTLATVNGNTGSFGSSTAIPNFTVNGKGLITAAGTNAVIAPAGTVTGVTLASNVTASSLTSVGTIGTGVWQATPVGTIYGGTGLNAYASGDLIYGSATNVLSRLAKGSDGQSLTLSGGLPVWSSSASLGTVTSVAVTVPAFMSVAGSPITSSGTIAISATSTGSGSVALSASPTFTGTANFSTLSAAAAVLNIGPNQPVATNSSSQLVAATTTGTGSLVLATSPTLVTPNLGTPSTLVGTNISGTASGLTAGNVTTNANLTGPITSSGNATSIGSQTGTGNTFAMSAGPTFTGTATFSTASASTITTNIGASVPVVATTGSGTLTAGTTTGSGSVVLSASPTLTGTSLFSGISGTTVTLPLAPSSVLGTNSSSQISLAATTGTGNVVRSVAPTLTGLVSSDSQNITGPLKVGTTSTIISAGEQTSILNSLAAVPSTVPNAITAETSLTSNSASTTAQLRTADIQTVRTVTANVSDTQSILNSNFRVTVNADTAHTYTNSGATGITALNIQNLLLSGAGSIAANYSALSYNSDTTAVTGYKTGIRFQSFSGGTTGNALIADNITHAQSAGGIQFSGAYTNNLGTGLSTFGSISSGAASVTGLSLSSITKTTTYTLTATDDTVLADTSGGAWTITAPAASSGKKLFRIRKTTSDFTVLTIGRTGSDTFSDNGTTGLTSTTVNTIGEEIELYSDGGSVWYVSRKIPSLWVAYTPTLTGFGTPSSVTGFWRRVGDSIQVSVNFTGGTVSAALAQISIPSNLALDTGKLPSTTSGNASPIVGNYGVNGQSNQFGSIVMASGTSTTTVYFSGVGNQTTMLVPCLANGPLTSSQPISTQFTVPISGWKG